MKTLPLLLLVFLIGCGEAAKTPADLVVTGATIISPDNEDTLIGDIAIVSGKIVEVGPGVSAKYEAAKVFDAKKKFVIPGLADMHSHFGNGILPADGNDSKHVLARHLYFGNTTIMNLGSYQAWIARIDEMRSDIKSGMPG